jgi:hypothetical protein
MRRYAWIGLLVPLCPLLRAQDVMTAKTLIQAEEEHGSSGTSIEPASTPLPMLMTRRDGWHWMLHGNGFANNTQQQARSPRNRDAFFSTNWVMPMAQHAFGAPRDDGSGDGAGGLLTLRAMFSLEPATVPGRNFPELFQQGETAYGAPIVDGQHPHDFFMEVAALYDLHLSRNTLLSFYAAPVGDPAVGPTAYPHRLSASEDPIAALGHHQEDSTHIAFDVVTGGLTYRWGRVELGGFHGAEPDEAHWHFQPSPNGLAIDSVATRVTVSPGADWTGQYSIAHIHSPESLYPNEDQQRQTASVMYNHIFRRGAGTPMGGGSMTGMRGGPMGGTSGMSGMSGMNGMDTGAQRPGGEAQRAMPPMQMVPEPRLDLSTTAVWGRAKSLADGSKENSYLLEALLRFAGSNYAWTRLENAGRSNELLLTPGTPLPEGFEELPIGHVAEYSFGYDHDLPLGRHVLAAPGVQVTAYRTPEALRGVYGTTPTAETFFVRFRPR